MASGTKHNSLRKIKHELYQACLQNIKERVALIEDNLNRIQESRNNETKSSAGDKYETGRAMLQIEEDNYKKQLHQALLLKNQLEQIDPSRYKSKVERGSLVTTNQGQYFISAALGQLPLEDETFFCISAASPIGQKLMGNGKGFRFDFNSTTIEIWEVC